jgi:hypothetical protein
VELPAFALPSRSTAFLFVPEAPPVEQQETVAAAGRRAVPGVQAAMPLAAAVKRSSSSGRLSASASVNPTGARNAVSFAAGEEWTSRVSICPEISLSLPRTSERR